jgi:hypothetical protein
MQKSFNYPLVILLGSVACLMSRPAACAFEDAGTITVVSSRVSDSYTRAKLANGSPQPEYYAFAEGGRWASGVNDASIDNLHFMDVARSVAGSLESRNYIPAKDPKETKLLIVLYWGRTITPHRADQSVAVQNLQDATAPAEAAKNSNAQQALAATAQLTAQGSTMACGHILADTAVTQIADQIDADNAFTGAMAVVAAENRGRDELDAQNAAMLGYDAWLNTSTTLQGTPLSHRRDDLVDELEHDRYFVVVMAYDFQAMWKQKQHKLLWETRFSVRQQGLEFDKQLQAISFNAAQYFGKDSHGLVHMAMPEGHVAVGDLKSLGPVAER